MFNILFRLAIKVDIKGVVLVGVSLSREVVPAFARILLHTSMGKKHMVRPLLRTEITQVINHRAWYGPTKLTPEVLNLYKAPLFVEGWDEALHEIGLLSFATVLSPQNAEALLKAVENLPVLVVVGAEDALVSLKSAQAMASKLVNSLDFKGGISPKEAWRRRLNGHANILKEFNVTFMEAVRMKWLEYYGPFEAVIDAANIGSL